MSKPSGEPLSEGVRTSAQGGQLVAPIADLLYDRGHSRVRLLLSHRGSSALGTNAILEPRKARRQDAAFLRCRSRFKQVWKIVLRAPRVKWKDSRRGRRNPSEGREQVVNYNTECEHVRVVTPRRLASPLRILGAILITGSVGFIVLILVSVEIFNADPLHGFYPALLSLGEWAILGSSLFAAGSWLGRNPPKVDRPMEGVNPPQTCQHPNSNRFYSIT
jgi:hypothetical protein